jgi:flagellar hook-basal body complex protein FliE
MDPVVNRAIAGYAQTPAAAPRSRPSATAEAGESFASFFRDVAKETANTIKDGERASIQGMQGTLDAQAVVEAVAAAELTVQTVTAVRDRVIEAYRELIRMPI